MSFVVRELTARAPGAVAVLELRGDGALAAVRALAAGTALDPGDLKRVSLRSATELLDEALCWADTSEHVELHLHGSPAVVGRINAELLERGGRRPGPAQTLEERAAELLALAASEAAARMLLDQVQGALRRELEALLELEGDTERVHDLLRGARVMEHLRRPPRVVLAGPVNAGKSTLFNVLVGHERVVVHDELGTTRDAVRERVAVGAYAVDLVDTAGERDLGTAAGAAQRVERAGQLLGRELRRSADLVLWLDPEGRGPSGSGTDTQEARLRVLVSRADGGAARGPEGLPQISALERPEEAREVVARAFHEALDLPLEPWEAGVAVPFERDQAEALEGLLSRDGARWREALESLLAR